MIKKSLFVLVVLVVFIGSLAYFNLHQLLRFQNDLPPFTHSVGESFVENVAMRDQIKLASHVFLPESDKAQSFPTILMRSPYAFMDSYFKSLCKLFNGYGYACVLQHTRGQGDSEGVWEPLVNEPFDGSDTLYWLVEQKWVDGNIGMWGVSYLALVQWSAAFDYPPELKTMVPISMGTDFHKTLFEQGAFRHFVTYWMMLIPDSAPDTDNVKEENFLNAVRHMPHTEVDKRFTDYELNWYRDWIASGSPGAPIWSREDAQQLARVAENLDIPVLMLDGWYDPFFGAQFQDYLDLGSRSNSVMVIGPWNHLQKAAGDLLPEDTPGATEVSLQMSLEWFDYHLKNNKHSKPEEGYIKVYDVGSNEWIRYQQWPPEHETLSFSLGEFEKSIDCEGGSLSLINELSGIEPNELAFKKERVSYTFDPDDPVMSRGGAGFLLGINELMAPGALLQDGLCERADVLTFISEPLDKDMTITGEVQAVLNVSSDAEDSMFTAKLMDVFPDGSAVNIRDSATTLRLRNNAVSELDYAAGERVEVNIKMWTIHWTLKKGHRLRLDISSSNFPAFNLHSNYAGPWEKQTKRKIAQQSVYAPSYLKLPIRMENTEKD